MARKRVEVDWHGDIFLEVVEAVISEQLEKAGETVASKTRSLLRLRSNPDPPGNKPSPVGRPPAVQTGRLKGSIGVSRVYRLGGVAWEGRTRTIDVGSGIKGTPVRYAFTHENKNNPHRRPYLSAALEKKTARIKTLLSFKNTIEKALKRAARELGGRI